MMYLLAILLPPLAILFAGRPFQAVANGLLWVLGLVLLLLPFVPGLPLLGVAIVWAILAVRGRQQDARDRRLVDDALARDRARRG
ncbi:YqaE/Pmp3 family membrane protein [Paracraurococcus ruber]|uniref:YqaE/Pmp3 family membrane protein n=2 Tax=Paracraurococcus ruber TaxID=77675 RepID=A0ABS1CY19_9PROT|nr:hypothetical protein [Paracraurococcus ruber]TDG33233.1 YqaE/Pmp3 family membrane protein [Paracraurococcus ruber]